MKAHSFRISKILMTLVFIVFTALVLVACGDNDAKIIQDAKGSITITYSSGDSEDGVTRNITLPTAAGDVQISWASSHPAIISATGVVVRPEEDTEVTLTATLTLGSERDTVTFKVTVTAAEIIINPEDALAAIVLIGQSLELVGAVYETTDNIELPTSVLGLTITWTTSNAGVITTSGVVTRPGFGSTDQVITLTASIQGEERQFLIKVLAYTEKPVSQKLEEAQTALLLDGIAGGVSSDLTLPATVGTEGVTVTWASSNTDYVTNAGKVTRPPRGEDDVSVTLVATLSLQGQSVTKEFTLLILADVPADLYANVAELLANASAGDFVEVRGVTIFGHTADSYFFGDSTGVIAAYGSTQEVIKGQVYDIIGYYDIYFGSPQFNATKDVTMPVVATPSDAAATVLVPREVSDIDAHIPDVVPTYNASNLFEYEYIRFTAKVRVQGNENYDTFFVDANYEGPNLDSSANSDHTKNGFIVYYQSNKAAFNAYDGKVITFDAFMYSYRDDRNIYTIVFLGTADDIVYQATDAEIAEMAKLGLEGTFRYEYIKDSTLNLPTESDLGATIVWASTSPLVDLDTGELTMPDAGLEEITLTATITKGDATEVFEVTFKAGDLPIVDISAAIESDVKHYIKIQGIVTANEYYRTYFVQDATGGIAIYSGWAPFQQFLADNYGKEVIILGERAVHNGLIQLSNIEEYELVGDGVLPAAVDINDLGLDPVALAEYQGQLVSVEGLIAVDVVADSYGNVTITLLDPISGKTMTMKWDSRTSLNETQNTLINGIEVGDVLDITAPLAWNQGPYFFFSDSTVVVEGVLSDVGAVAATKSALTVVADDPVVEDTQLTLLASYLGTAITWASNNTEVITNAGAVTVTENMEQVEVTLTATITKGTETDTKEFVIVVGDILPITLAAQAANGTIVKFVGVVTGFTPYSSQFGNYDKVWVQDGSGAITVYRPALPETLAIGDKFVFTGERATFSGLIQLAAGSSFEFISAENALPASVDFDNVEAITAEFQAQRVNISGVVVSVDANGQVLKVKIGEKVVDVRAISNVVAEAVNAHLITAVPGQTVNLKNIHVDWYNGPQFLPTQVAQVEFIPLTDEEKLALDADAIVLPEAIDEDTTLTLPAAGALGSAIAWASSDNAVIDPVTGAVVVPEEGVTVTLTATLTLGDEDPLIVTFDIIVSSELEATGGVVTIEFSGTTGNMSGDNDAALFGLDDDLFTVTSEKGAAGNHVGVNAAGQIRIYSVRASGDGNTLTVGIAEGYVITKVVITFVTASNQSTSGLLTLGEDEIEITDFTAVASHDNLEIDAFSLKNTHLGGSANGQIWITSIEVTYDVVEAGELALLADWDFGTAAKTGYGEGNITWTNTDETEVTANKDRVQSNISTFVPHDTQGAFLVFSIRNTHSTAFIDLDLTEFANVAKISFKISTWNQAQVNASKNVEDGYFALQVFENEEWVNVLNHLGEEDSLPLLTADVYTEVSFDVDGPGLYRIIYYGVSTATGNTTTTITVDDLQIFG